MTAPKSDFNRIDLIQMIIDKIDAKIYLEIGVFNGYTFFNVKCRQKIAVDPQFKIKEKKKIKSIMKNFANLANKYYEMTSDEFFAQHQQELVATPPKVVFIDGLHTFEQTLKDCYNSLNYLAEGGVLILHDCSPPTKASAIPAVSIDDAEQKWKQQHSPDDSGWTGEWCGDTWKTIPYLLKNHPELNICVLNTDYGLGVVSRKNSRICYEFSSQGKSLCNDISEFQNLDFAFLEKHRRETLNLKEMNQLDEVINLHC